MKNNNCNRNSFIHTARQMTCLIVFIFGSDAIALNEAAQKNSNLQTVLTCSALEGRLPDHETTLFLKHRKIAERSEHYIIVNQVREGIYISSGQRPIKYNLNADHQIFFNPLFEIDLRLDEVSRNGVHSIQHITGSFADYNSGEDAILDENLECRDDIIL